jgi:hypothetical protein
LTSPRRQGANKLNPRYKSRAIEPTWRPLHVYPGGDDPIYDIGELALSTYFQAVDFGKEITALPIFPSRFFPHSQISNNVNAGIGAPGI